MSELFERTESIPNIAHSNNDITESPAKFCLMDEENRLENYSSPTRPNTYEAGFTEMKSSIWNKHIINPNAFKTKLLTIFEHIYISLDFNLQLTFSMKIINK